MFKKIKKVRSELHLPIRYTFRRCSIQSSAHNGLPKLVNDFHWRWLDTHIQLSTTFLHLKGSARFVLDRHTIVINTHITKQNLLRDENLLIDLGLELLNVVIIAVLT